jgi:hypothetical protein
MIISNITTEAPDRVVTWKEARQTRRIHIMAYSRFHLRQVQLRRLICLCQHR